MAIQQNSSQCVATTCSPYVSQAALKLFCLFYRTSLKDKSFPIGCPELGCFCTLDLEGDIKPVFITKKEVKEYEELLDVAAVKCVAEKDRFYCPNPACSALYQFTNNKWVSVQVMQCSGTTDTQTDISLYEIHMVFCLMDTPLHLSISR